MGKKARRKIIFPVSFARRSALPFLKKASGTWKRRGHRDGWMWFLSVGGMMFFLCFTFQVRASSSCNRSRRAAKAAAKAFEGAAWSHEMESSWDGWPIQWVCRLVPSGILCWLISALWLSGDDRRLSDADSEPQAEIQGRMTFESIWGAFLRTPRESTQRVRFHTDNETSFFLGGQAKGAIFLRPLCFYPQSTMCWLLYPPVWWMCA